MLQDDKVLLMLSVPTILLFDKAKILEFKIHKKKTLLRIWLFSVQSAVALALQSTEALAFL